MDNTKLFNAAKHVFLNPADNWKQLASVTKGVPGVYALVNKITGKYYIGSSINLYNRLRDYYSPWYISANPNLLISKAIVKYGFIHFNILILDTCTTDDVTAREQFFLDEYKPEYNILKFAYRPTGFKHTAETKAKMRESNKYRIDLQGYPVKVTDTITGDVAIYKSIREAADMMHAGQATLRTYNQSGELYKKRYLIQVSK